MPAKRKPEPANEKPRAKRRRRRQSADRKLERLGNGNEAETQEGRREPGWVNDLSVKINAISDDCTGDENDLENGELVGNIQRTKNIGIFIGAHVSMAEGIYNSVYNAVQIGGNAFALFLRSQRRWESAAMKQDDVTRFKDLCREHAYCPETQILPHGSYLVNLASHLPELREKSLQCFLDDLRRCVSLGIANYNFHPGNTNGAPRGEACARIADAINSAHGEVKGITLLLETMASSKPTSNVIGSSFEDLAKIIAGVEDKSRVGVCFDTCHVFAAGYDIASEQGFRQTMESFDQVIGRSYLRAWHLNDSKAPLGSGRDLHANIGTGFIGLKGFWNVMNMSIWGDGVGVCGLPMVLETPLGHNIANANAISSRHRARKREREQGTWAEEIKLLEGLIGLDMQSEKFQALEIALRERGKESNDDNKPTMSRGEEKRSNKRASRKLNK